MQVTSAKFVISAPDLASCPKSELREFAFIGRSNVGKSSLLNMLTNSKALAKVSVTPGHTRLLNFFLINNAWTLVDLPGYGYAKTQRGERDLFAKMITSFISGRENLGGVFVLIDSRHTPQVIDLEFVEWIAGVGVPYALVFSKADKVKPGVVQSHVALFLEQVARFSSQPPPVFITSAQTRSGRRELLDCIAKAVTGDGSIG
jgi:GTP-binding protein